MLLSRSCRLHLPRPPFRENVGKTDSSLILSQQTLAAATVHCNALDVPPKTEFCQRNSSFRAQSSQTTGKTNITRARRTHTFSRNRLDPLTPVWTAVGVADQFNLKSNVVRALRTHAFSMDSGAILFAKFVECGTVNPNEP